MPELPEVQTVVSDLQEVLPGKQIASVQVLWERTVHGFSRAQFRDSLQHKRINGVTRRAKFIVIELKDVEKKEAQQEFLLFHLRMSGQLFWKQGLETPTQHTRILLTFTDGSTLIFNDMRKFGRAYYFPSRSKMEQSVFSKLGPEPLEMSAPEFLHIFQKRTGGIKANLLRQDLIAGIGNIYADESLYAAKIHPETPTNLIPKKQLGKLFLAIQDILLKAINLRGTSMRSYLDTTGNAGKYKQILSVYQQEGKPCKRCQTPILKIRVAGRGTHICPQCQEKGKE